MVFCGAMGRFTRREWSTLITIGAVNFGTALCVALQAPFYPQEAESKGASATEYGLVFGIFEMTAFFSSPIFGKYIDFLDAVFLVRTGVLVTGVCSVLFGLLHLTNSHGAFIGLSFAIRIVESLGASAAVTASFSIIAAVFPDRVATTFACLDVLYGFGYIAGPTFGGLLFTLGGFMLPFMTVGVFLLVVGSIICCILPPLDLGPAPRPQATLCSFLRLPPVLLAAFSVMAADISAGFYAATLEPHLRQFGLTTLKIGAIFIINGVVYAVTAPLVGKLCDTWVSPRKVVVIGAVLGALSFALVGPLPYTGLYPSLWMCCFGLVIQGLSDACLWVPAFIGGIHSAVKCGLPDDITTYGMISGLWASSGALGGFLGASGAGILFDLVGFRVGTLFPIAVYLLLMLAMIIFASVDPRPLPKPVLLHLPASFVHEDLKGTGGQYGSLFTQT